MTMNTIGRMVLVSVAASLLASAQQWQSTLLTVNPNSTLQYSRDSKGNRIPDFSYAGYRNGNEEIPAVPMVRTLTPIAGDNTARIQAAIDSVAKLPLNPQGIRGALKLEAGMYRVYGTIYVNESGIVLRGAGQGSDSTTNSIILAIGDTPHQRSVIVAGGGSTSRWKEKDGTVAQQNITTDSVKLGSVKFTLADASQYSVGDNIIITHPCTDAWLKAIDYGGTHTGESGADSVDLPWAVNSYPILYNRNIIAKSGNEIIIDVPLFYTLVRSLSQCYVYKYARTKLRTKIGIENLRVDVLVNDVTSNADGNEDHAWQCIELNQLEDSWVRDCTTLHFGQSGVITNTSTRVTVERCSALDPISIITGERRYNFNTYTASQLVLFKDCKATNGRHSYVSNGASLASGNVFVDCTVSGSYASSEGHRAWSQGLLWDNHRELDGPRSGLTIVLALYNRGYYGTSHGWATVNSVAWKCNVRTAALILQQPPTGQNFAIGCTGNVSGNNPPAPFTHPQGFIEGTAKDSLNPRSLYYAQLASRKAIIQAAPRGDLLPQQYDLFQNFPNPFNPATRITYVVPPGRGTNSLRLSVFDMVGREVSTLVSGPAEQGTHSVEFSGQGLASGPYIVQLVTDDFVSTKRMLLLK